jgi:hypothetical protein
VTATRWEKRLKLPQVTICAVTSVNVKATMRALEASLGQIAFAECLLLTDADLLSDNREIRVVPIERIGSSAAYSDFVLNQLVDHVDTSHCLIVQWDGHVLDAGRWASAFLDYDYIGASWPQFDDGYDVGNGGFSLRSRRLMEVCRTSGFRQIHPEDLAIGRINRQLLEERGMRFAPRHLADRFAAERAGNVQETFGYHGVFNMPQALGVESFWQVYSDLDNWGTVRHDFKSIFQDVRRGPGGLGRAVQMLKDRLSYALRKR